MSEDPKVQASGTTDGDKGTPVTQPPATDADWKAERIKAQRQAKAALAENEQLKKQLAEIENAKKSEHEKAIEAAAKAAREATLAEVNGTILQKDIRSEIRLKLAEAGVPANQTAVILDESKPETVEDAIAAATAYAEKWKAEIARPDTAKTPGVPGAPTPRQEAKDWTSGALRTASKEDLKKHSAEIEAQMQKRITG